MLRGVRSFEHIRVGGAGRWASLHTCNEVTKKDNGEETKAEERRHESHVDGTDAQWQPQVVSLEHMQQGVVSLLAEAELAPHSAPQHVQQPSGQERAVLHDSPHIGTQKETYGGERGTPRPTNKPAGAESNELETNTKAETTVATMHQEEETVAQATHAQSSPGGIFNGMGTPPPPTQGVLEMLEELEREQDWQHSQDAQPSTMNNDNNDNNTGNTGNSVQYVDFFSDDLVTATPDRTTRTSARADQLRTRAPLKTEQHSDLASFLAFQESNDADTESTYHVGTVYEYECQHALEAQGMVLSRTGAAYDRGIDLHGEWPAVQGLSVVVQCKKTKRRVSAGVVREFEGALQQAAESALPRLGILSSDAGFTPDAKRHAQNSNTPMVMAIVRNEHLRHFDTNAPAAQLLEGHVQVASSIQESRDANGRLHHARNIRLVQVEPK